MNLSQYLCHADECAVNKPYYDQICKNCNHRLGDHYEPNNVLHCPIQTPGKLYDSSTKFEGITDCTCQLDQLKERIVLLPENYEDDFTAILGELEHGEIETDDAYGAILNLLKGKGDA